MPFSAIQIVITAARAVVADFGGEILVLSDAYQLLIQLDLQTSPHLREKVICDDIRVIALRQTH